MRRLRFWTTFGILVLPLILLGFGASVCVRGVWQYLNSGARLAGVASVALTQALGRPVHVRDIKLTGRLWPLTARNAIVARGVTVANNPAGTGPLLLSADKITLDYNLRQALLVNDLLVPRVESLTVTGGRGVIHRSPQGTWNFQPLIAKQTAVGRPFLNKIVVERSACSYFDQHFPHPAALPSRPFHANLHDVSGVLLLRQDRSLAFDANVRGEPREFQQAHVVGSVRIHPLRLDLHITASRIALPLITDRLLASSKARLKSGYGDLDITVGALPSSELPGLTPGHNVVDVSGSVHLLHVAVNVPAFNAPIEDVSGQASFTDDSVTADLTGQLDGARASVNATLFNLGGHYPSPVQETQLEPPPVHSSVPTIALNGTLQQVDVARLARAFHLEQRFPHLSPDIRARLRHAVGQGQLTFQVGGRFDSPTATLAARFASLRSASYHAENVDLRALLTGKRIRADLRARYAGGDVAARALVAVDNSEAYHVQAQGRSMKLAQAGIPLKQPISGTGQFDLIVQGQRNQTPQINGQAQVFGLNHDKNTLDSAYIRAESVGDLLHIRAARAEGPQAFALAGGTVNLKTRALDLRVEADNIDLASVADLLRRNAPQPPAMPTEPETPPLQVAGTGYLRGKVTGTVKNPLLSGKLSVFALQAGKADIDTAELAFDLSRDALIVSQGTLRQYPGLVSFTGLITDPFKPDPGIDITASADHLDIDSLLEQAGFQMDNLSLTGTISTDLRARGTLEAPVVTVRNTDVQDTTVNGVPVQSATLQGRYSEGVFAIANATVQVTGGKLNATGTVNRDGAFALDIRGDGLQLDTLEDALPSPPPVDVKGALSFSGVVSGTKEEPKANVTVTTEGLTFNGVTLGELHGEATYQDKQVIAKNVTLHETAPTPQNLNDVAISRLEYNTETKAVSGNGQIREIAIQKLRDLLQNSAYARSEEGKNALASLTQITNPIDGALTGDVALSGTLDEPVADVTWNAHDIKVDDHLITALTGSTRMTKEQATIPSPAMPQRIARLTSQDGAIDAKGVVIYDGDIKGDLSAYNINLSFLQNWFKEDFAREIGGEGDLFVVASGQTKAPTLDISVNLRDLSYHGQTVDRLDIDHAVIKDGLLTADTIALIKKETVGGQQVTYTGKASGSIGFSWSAPFIPEDAPLDFQANVPKQSLQLFAAFAPGVIGDSEGTFAADVHATGTRSDPQVTGSLTVQASRLRETNFQTGLRDVDAVIAFRGDRLEVDKFTATSQVYKKVNNKITDEPVPKQTGEPLTLTGSLPLVASNENGQPERGTLELKAPKILFEESPLPGINSGSAKGEANIDLKVTGALNDPRIGGDITINNAQTTLPSNFGGLQSGTVTYPVNPKFAVNIRLGDKVDLKNAELDARTSGSISLTGDLAAPRLQGALALNGGTMTLPTARFAIQPGGSLRLLYPEVSQETFGQPTLGITIENLKAVTTKYAASTSGIARNYKITVTARGPLTGETVDPNTGDSRLTLTFQTDPPDLAVAANRTYNQQILDLFGGDAISGFGRSPGQAFASLFGQAFTNTAVQGVFDRSGLGAFSLGYDPLAGLNFQFNRHLIGPLYGSYSRSVGSDFIYYEYKLSLRFSDRYQLSFTSDEMNLNELLLEGIFKF